MKLQTKLKVYGPKALDFDYTKQGLHDDALAAHAPLQALREFTFSPSMDAVSWVPKRAFELLAEWGVTVHGMQ